MFTASNNRFTGEDGQSITRNMKIEEDAINRLKNPESRAKNFPRHVFRRIRPWAGCKISKEYINQDDLDQLPQWPTARRPFNPRVEVTTPVMNAPRRVSNSPPRPAPPAPQGPRRNPRRGCQNPQKTFGNWIAALVPLYPGFFYKDYVLFVANIKKAAGSALHTICVWEYHKRVKHWWSKIGYMAFLCMIWYVF